MNTSSEFTRPSTGQATASLLLGLLAVVSGVFLIGGLFGLIGLVLAILQLRRPNAPKGRAWTGLVLSAVGLLLACGMVPIYKMVAKSMREMVKKSRQDLDQLIGVPAPDFTVTALDGTTITLHELKGKRVVLDFWATWCPPCRKEIPHFNELRSQVSPEELVIVGISDEDERTLKSFVEKNRVDYPIASAENLPPPYSSIQALPTTFFLDRNGVIQHVAVGYHDLDSLKEHALGKDYEGMQ